MTALVLVALGAAGVFQPAATQTSAAIGGLATWYSDGPGIYAAAGPDLRQWLGRDWRGETVVVSGQAGSVTVRLGDWCACADRSGRPTLIDLSIDAFRQLAPPSAGVTPVTITRVGVRGPAPSPAPPATDVGP